MVLCSLSLSFTVCSLGVFIGFLFALSHASESKEDLPGFIRATLNRPLELPCKGPATKNASKVQVKWQKNGKIVSGKNEPHIINHSDNLTFTSFLDFISVQYADSGNYICSIFDELTNSITTKSLQLIVQGPPELSLGLNHKKSVITKKVGETLYLPCHVIGYPKPSVEWLKNGAPIHNGHTRKLSEGNLTIENLDGTDSGSYQCVSRNSLGRKSSIPLHVMVEGMYFRPVYNENKYVNDGENASLLCSAQSSRDYKIHYSWLKNGKPVEDIDHEEGSENSIKVNDNTIQISKVKESSLGTYTCVAKQGTWSIRHNTNIKYRTTPSPPVTNVHVNKKNMEAELQWKDGPNGGYPITSYILSYEINHVDKNIVERKQVKLGKNQQKIIFHDVCQFCRFNLQISAVNEKGKGRPMHVSFSLLPASYSRFQGKNTDESDDGINQYGIIGLGAAIVLCLGTFSFCFLAYAIKKYWSVRHLKPISKDKEMDKLKEQEKLKVVEEEYRKTNPNYTQSNDSWTEETRIVMEKAKQMRKDNMSSNSTSSSASSGVDIHCSERSVYSSVPTEDIETSPEQDRLMSARSEPSDINRVDSNSYYDSGIYQMYPEPTRYY